MKKVIVIAVLLSITCPTLSFGWGRRGHAIVATIAFNMVDTSIQHKIQHYLGDMTMEQAGNWMDDIKSDRKYDYMKVWHYVNIDKGSSYEPSKEENVINELKRAISELEHKSTMSNEDIKKDLLVAFHLTADMHQPLHVGYGDDKGGNSVQVKYLGHSSNLHRTWDSEIIESENITINDCLQKMNSFDKEQLASLSVINVENWMRLPRTQLGSVYNFKDETLDIAYVQRNKKLVEEDLFIAGIRLAAILKDVFKS